MNELEEVKRLVKQIDIENDEYYELTINPTMNCNFKCWYCYETHIKSSKMTDQTINAVVKAVTKIVESNKRLNHFNLRWFGGEPLLYFDTTVLPILQQIKPLFDNNNIRGAFQIVAIERKD